MNKWNPDSPVNAAGNKRRSFYNLAKSEQDNETKPIKTKRKTMTITEQTWDMVTEHGRKGQTYDRIIYEAILAAKQLEKVKAELQEIKNQIAGLCYCNECSFKFFISEKQADNTYPVIACPDCRSRDTSMIGEF